MIDPKLAEQLDNELEADLEPKKGRIGMVERYKNGDHDLPYQPRQAKAEFKHLAERSITNWLPLFPETFGRGLVLDGYRPAKAGENSKAWDYAWQANGLDARQTIATRGALEHGTSYAMVLPGKRGAANTPVFRPLSPLKSMAWYEDDDDEYPAYAMRRKGTTVAGDRINEYFDKERVYTYVLPKEAGSGWRLVGVDSHGLKVTPFVRFRETLVGDPQGVIRPLITLQNRINEIVFSTLIALQYASFRQRWATGLAIPEDEQGNPIEPFQSAIDRLWVTDSETVKFGDFAQTDTSGHSAMYSEAVRTMAGIGQVSPNILTGDLINVSADALAQLEATTQRKISEYKVVFGESWESGFRLAALAKGDLAGYKDLSAQVRWADTEARSLAQTIDALGKAAQMLQVPVEALWERIPGVTDTDITYWKSIRQVDPLQEFAAELQRQTTVPGNATKPAATPPSPTKPAA